MRIDLTTTIVLDDTLKISDLRKHNSLEHDALQYGTLAIEGGGGLKFDDLVILYVVYSHWLTMFPILGCRATEAERGRRGVS